MKPKVILVDLDGTLALNEHRYHHIYPRDGQQPNWDSFFLDSDKDLPNKPVIEVVKSLKDRGFYIHILSARGSIALAITKNWLAENSVPHDQLTLREIGSFTPDEELKRQWLLEMYPNYLSDIFLVIDDRKKVVDMWRSLGLSCFQVAKGDF